MTTDQCYASLLWISPRNNVYGDIFSTYISDVTYSECGNKIKVETPCSPARKNNPKEKILQKL